MPDLLLVNVILQGDIADGHLVQHTVTDELPVVLACGGVADLALHIQADAVLPQLQGPAQGLLPVLMLPENEHPGGCGAGGQCLGKRAGLHHVAVQIHHVEHGGVAGEDALVVHAFHLELQVFHPVASSKSPGSRSHRQLQTSDGSAPGSPGYSSPLENRSWMGMVLG